MKKLSYDEVKKIIESKDCKLISKEYVNIDTALEIQCSCGNVSIKSLRHFKHNHLCSECTKKLKSKKEKHSIEYIRSKIEAVGYKLLSTEYKNNRSKIKVQCDKGHIYETTWSMFNVGVRCPYRSKTKKKTYDEVKSYIESFEGYKLLSTKYINSKTKLELQCPKGHKFKMLYNNFQQGSRYYKCSYSERGLKKKHTYSFIKEQVEKRGFKLLSKEYKGVDNKIKIQCPEGHITETSFKSFFKSKYGCKICYYKVAGSSKKLSYSFVKQYIESQGYKLLSETFKNVGSKIILQCPEGHIWKTSFHAFKDAGVRCIHCLNKENNVNKKYTYKEVKEYIESFGYKLLSTEYKNNRQKLKVECPEGHKLYTTFHSFKVGNRCAKCHYLSLRKYFTKEELRKFKTYKESVYRITEHNYKKYYDYINKNNLKRSKYEYHLDHIYPTIAGFRNNIKPEIIANPNNLQILWWEDNLSKNDKEVITKQLLYHIVF